MPQAKPWHNRTIAQPFEVNTMEADGNTEGKLQGCEIATRTLSRELEECEEEILTLAIKCDPVFSDGAVVIPEFGETQSRRNEREVLYLRNKIKLIVPRGAISHFLQFMFFLQEFYG